MSALNEKKFKPVLYISIFIFAFMCIFPQATSRALQNPTSTAEDSLEQRLIEEILALDSKVMAYQKRIEELSSQREKLQNELDKKRRELANLDIEFRKKQQELSKWILFSYKGGLGNFMAVLVGAESMGDFFRRLDNISRYLEYYNTVINETKSLITRRKQEELDIMEKHNQIKKLEEQARIALNTLQQTLAQKRQQLEHARSVLKDTAFLEELSKNWQQALPSLDYLLRNLSALPWKSLNPDQLRVNYFTLTAEAQFYDKSLTQKLLSQDEKLKNVYFTFSPEGITVSEKKPESTEPLYSITCSLEITPDQKIKFTPIRLEFNGVVLPPEVIKELMSDYDLYFTPPELPFDLKITSIVPDEGRLIMNLKR